MNRKVLKISCFITALFTIFACSKSTSVDVEKDLQQLINAGYSVRELSIRTDYSEEELISAYQSMDNILTDSVKNQKIHKILELHEAEKIIPVNKTNISAYDCIWQIYNKAQNLPRASLYTGIGVSKVACALMKRKPLSEEDSIRALVGYINMRYELDDMPSSIDKYYTRTALLKDVVVPVDFRPTVSDETKTKIDYYIYQNEQLELKANDNLHKSLDSKINSQISAAIDQFIEDDMGSIENTVKCLFKDSIEEVNFYKDKLAKRLALDKLDKDVRDEIITYCVSVNCSRAILINEILNYNDYTKSVDVPERILLEEYITRLENITKILEKQKQDLGIDAGIMVISIPLSFATSGVMNQATTMFSIHAAKVLVVETLMYSGLEGIVKDSFDYETNESSITESKNKLQKKLKSDLNKQIANSLGGENNYFDSLNKNTHEYYQQVRNYFSIK